MKHSIYFHSTEFLLESFSQKYVVWVYNQVVRKLWWHLYLHKSIQHQISQNQIFGMRKFFRQIYGVFSFPLSSFNEWRFSLIVATKTQHHFHLSFSNGTSCEYDHTRKVHSMNYRECMF